MLVLDASAAVELVAETPLGRVVAAHLQGENGPLHAPHLLDVEVLSALRQLVRTRQLPREDAESAMSSFRLLPVVRQSQGAVACGACFFGRPASACAASS